MKLSVGVLVNPIAGIGGAVGHKGSDDRSLHASAATAGGEPRAPARLAAMFEAAPALKHDLDWYCAGGAMGAELLADNGVPHSVVFEPAFPSTKTDTHAAAQQLAGKVDLLLFFGGDGTARDVMDAIGFAVPTLGVPCGVKMHSGVFATSPRAAAEVLSRLVDGELVARQIAEVRDVDEVAVREGRAASRYYGELHVPESSGFVQATKIGGREDEALAVEEIVQGCLDRLQGITRPVVLGPGGTMSALKSALGATPTLLGFDVLLQTGDWLLDVSFRELEALQKPYLFLSFGRNQGILIGRGNQQLSPAFLRGLRRDEDICVVASRGKLASLEGKPLLLDTSDAQLDEAWSGLWPILVGFEDTLLHRVARA